MFIKPVLHFQICRTPDLFEDKIRVIPVVVCKVRSSLISCVVHRVNRIPYANRCSNAMLMVIIIIIIIQLIIIAHKRIFSQDNFRVGKLCSIREGDIGVVDA